MKSQLGQVLLARRALQPGKDRIGRFLNAPFRRELVERFPDGGKTLLDKFLVDFQDSHIESGSGRDLSDSRAHQAATEHANFLDFHNTPFLATEDTGNREETSFLRDLCVLCG